MNNLHNFTLPMSEKTLIMTIPLKLSQFASQFHHLTWCCAQGFKQQLVTQWFLLSVTRSATYYIVCIDAFTLLGEKVQLAV